MRNRWRYCECNEQIFLHGRVKENENKKTFIIKIRKNWYDEERKLREFDSLMKEYREERQQEMVVNLVNFFEMDGRGMCESVVKRNIANVYIGEEDVLSHYGLRPEVTGHIKEENLTAIQNKLSRSIPSKF